MQANSQDAVPFDRQDQLDKIVAGLIQGENVLAVYDAREGGTGFIGLTDRRVVIQDNSLAGGRSAVVSLPYSRINAVAFVADKSMFGKWNESSEITIFTGATSYSVAFRGADKAKHAHDLILWNLR